MTITIPETPDQVVELLNDTKQFGQVVKDGQFGTVMAAYADKAMTAGNGDLEKQLDERIQAGMAEFLKDSKEQQGTVPVHEDAVRAMRPDTRFRDRHCLFSPRAVGAQFDSQPWAESPGHFLMEVLRTKTEAGSEAAKAFRAIQDGQAIQNAMAERVPSAGGFLIPEVLRSQILMVALESAVVRPLARTIPMDSLRVPYPTIDDTSHTSSVFGGVTGYWTEEAAALVASQPSFGRIVLEAKKLTAYTEIPNELLSDAVAALNQFFNQMFPQALAWFEDVAFIAGTGVGSPQGFLNSPCAVPVTRNASSKVKYTDIATMYPRMIPASLNKAVWVCAPDVIGQLLQLLMPAADGSAANVAPPLWLTGQQAIANPGGQGGGNQGWGPQYSLLGRPLYVSEKMSALGTKGDLAFVDFGYYLLGDRMTLQVANSDEYKFQNDLTAFRVIERVDGRTWLQSPITPENASANTLSPVVVLN